MLKKYFLRTFFNPILCNKINITKYPWGWKSKEDIDKIIDFEISDEKMFVHHNRKSFHEYNLNKYTENMYINTYYAYYNDYDFLNSNLFCPKLANGLNYLREKRDIHVFDDNIHINKVTLLQNWIKYGKVKNKNKFLGLYDKHEFTHEIITGMIGPEIQSIWDQQSIKQKVKLLIELDNRKDVFEFERNLMIPDGYWQLCNINRIIT